jgi:osmotically-inducible protein OsmY
MGTMSFMRASGYVVFEREATELAVIAMTAGPPDAQTRAHYREINQAAAQAIRARLLSKKLDIQALSVEFDGIRSTVTLKGAVPDQATRIKAVLTCGEIWGVALVEDHMTVSALSAALERWQSVAHHALQSWPATASL